MRVIAGRYKGQRLEAPTWDGLRPTSDKLRETLFNILAPRIDGARVLDGFAGTGAIGLDALSRGAAHVTLIERDRRARALIARNLAICPEPDRYKIECGDFVTELPRLDAGLRFDLVVLDPPYDHRGVAEALRISADRLTADGVVVLERATRREPDVPPSLERYRDVKSGDSTLTFLRLVRPDAAPEAR